MLGVLNPCGGGDPIPLIRTKLLVGRRPSCDIVLPFANVSSHHCELELKGGYWHIRDLGSSNGIKVNGERCLSRCICPGDEVQISKHAFHIQYDIAADAEAPEEENPMAMGLLEKAGLEVDRAAARRQASEAGNGAGASHRNRRPVTEDDFLMEWLKE
ncbi:MAG: FHA domain-containing protein [Planctomyces sp.]|jgi:predicted component of type VI protein secretion system